MGDRELHTCCNANAEHAPQYGPTTTGVQAFQQANPLCEEDDLHGVPLTPHAQQWKAQHHTMSPMNDGDLCGSHRRHPTSPEASAQAADGGRIADAAQSTAPSRSWCSIVLEQNSPEMVKHIERRPLTHDWSSPRGASGDGAREILGPGSGACSKRSIGGEHTSACPAQCSEILLDSCPLARPALADLWPPGSCGSVTNSPPRI